LPKDLLLQQVTKNGVFVRDKHACAEIDVNGCSNRFQLAAHVDKQPMACLATMGTSVDVPEQVRERVYYDPEIDDIVNWSGTLNQPAMHALSRSHFNAVDLFNRLAFGPGSVSAAINTKSADTRLFLACLAVVVTNAFFACKERNGLTSKDMTDGRVQSAPCQGVHT
jgi:hypothetical protein